MINPQRTIVPIRNFKQVSTMLVFVVNFLKPFLNV
jgi:hypothetical protein